MKPAGEQNLLCRLSHDATGHRRAIVLATLYSILNKAFALAPPALIGAAVDAGVYSLLVFMTRRLLWPRTRLGTTLDLYQRGIASTRRVCRDGHDLRTPRLDDLRHAIGPVSPDLFLFHGTVRENSAYGKFGASMEEIVEAAIQRSLARIVLARTTLVMARRLSTARHADRIFVLDEGQMVEQGRHEKPIAQDGIYAMLWRMQTGEQMPGGNGRHPANVPA